MNAATLMNSGTVTKKPAMKLRRSHCMIAPQPAQPAMRRQQRAGPSAMRYQANGAKPERRTNARNGRTTSSDATNAITNPTAISGAALGARSVPHARAGRARTRPPSSASPGRTRTRRRPADRGRVSMPPTIVAPDRDTPGTSASVWHSPIAERAARPACRSASMTVGRGARRARRPASRCRRR